MNTPCMDNTNHITFHEYHPLCGDELAINLRILPYIPLKPPLKSHEYP